MVKIYLFTYLTGWIRETKKRREGERERERRQRSFSNYWINSQMAATAPGRARPKPRAQSSTKICVSGTKYLDPSLLTSHAHWQDVRTQLAPQYGLLVSLAGGIALLGALC